MGRTLKRVPMDFNHPHGEIWPGYLGDGMIHKPCPSCKGGTLEENDCRTCWGEARLSEPVDPPAGDGYQMWETTTEGSPKTPVFATLRELAEHCATECFTFASLRGTADEWERILGSRYGIPHDWPKER